MLYASVENKNPLYLSKKHVLYRPLYLASQIQILRVSEPLTASAKDKN